MDRHPSAFIDAWIEDLIFAFDRAERRYERALDRGTPRETALRDVLRSYLPGKYGVAAGHVISSKPAWSRQSDLIIYDALEAPTLSRDEAFQGTVLPVESVHGIFEIKSTLDAQAFRDAAEKIAAFKRLSAEQTNPLLRDRFGLVFAFQGSREEADINTLLAIARSYPDGEQIDGVLVLGTTRTPATVLIQRIPHGSPEGQLDFHVFRGGRKNLRVFLLDLESRLRGSRTVSPDALAYLFDSATETKSEQDPDVKLLRLQGEASRDAVKSALASKLRNCCPMCGASSIGLYEDLYYIVATKDYHAGQLGVPQIPVAVAQCQNCGFLCLHSSHLLGITTAD